jgi:hypothetical protein
MLEQGFAGGGQFVALGMLHKQRGAEAFLDRIDMRAHTAAVVFRRCAAVSRRPLRATRENTAGHSSRTAPPLLEPEPRCLKTHSSWAKTNIFKPKTNN